MMKTYKVEIEGEFDSIEVKKDSLNAAFDYAVRIAHQPPFDPRDMDDPTIRVRVWREDEGGATVEEDSTVVDLRDGSRP